MDEVLATLRGMEFSSVDVTLNIETATCFSEAQTELSKNFFDVIVLDLKIPVMPEDDASLEHSKSLYSFVRTYAPSKPFYILGLTSEPLDKVDKVFTENSNFAIRKYDAEGVWVETLQNRIEFVVGAKSGLANHLNNNVGIEVLIVTARKSNEFDPIYDSIDWLGGRTKKSSKVNGLHNAFGHIRLSTGKEISVGMVCLEEMGLSHSAAVASNLINTFRPRHLAMLGMCCGLKKITNPARRKPSGSQCKLGDVIVARETCCWDEGKYESTDPKLLDSPFFYNRAVDKKPESEFWRSVDRFLDESQKGIQDEVSEYYRSQDLEKIKKGLKGKVAFSPEAELHWGGMVSGACVIDSQELIGNIETRFPRALALEMEAHSIYAAVECTMGVKPKTLVIKGVADFGDGTKAKPVQGIASVGAYLTYRAILENQYIKDSIA
ncbi:hypothetical protein [Yoonia sp. 2307UL14-13]|uniref:hypothetical protein n=1 Tax=Yoonia sp. 2307UL14-13 TaxID=3126506 RepID=UPI0030B2A0C5